MKRFWMRLLFSVLPFLPAAVAAQQERPCQRSVSLGLGGGVLFNHLRGTAGTRKLFAIPNYVLALSADLYRGFGVTAGLRGGSYLSPALPDGYSSGFSLDNKSDKAYDDYQARHLLLTYDLYRTFQARKRSSSGLQIRPGLGIAENRVRTTRFTRAQSAGGILSLGASHDAQWQETAQTGWTAQLGLSVYGRVAKSGLVTFGPTFWTLPSSEKRFYGVDIRVGYALGWNSERKESNRE